MIAEILSNLPGAALLLGLLLLIIGIAGDVKTPWLHLQLAERSKRIAMGILGVLVISVGAVAAWSGPLRTRGIGADVPSLDGEWDLTLYSSRGQEGHGKVSIQQGEGSPFLAAQGEVKNPGLDSQTITFSTIMGVIEGREVYLLWRNIRDEIGVVKGVVTSKVPKSLELEYTDLEGYDKNNDPRGRLVLTRR